MRTTSTKALAAVFVAALAGTIYLASDLESPQPGCPAEREDIGGAEVRRICIPETGVVTYEQWRRENNLHRELHREDGPAVILRDAATGRVTSEVWFREGKQHRADGPAIIERDAATGVTTREEWLREGKQHREGGPAVIRRDPATGEPTREEWWRDGVPQEPPQRDPRLPRPGPER